MVFWRLTCGVETGFGKGRGMAQTFLAACLLVSGCTSPDEFEPDDSEESASFIAGNGLQEHSFHDSFDIDYVAVVASVGLEYHFYTTELEGSLDTVLTLFDGSGEVITSNDDFEGAASRIDFLAPESATYYLLVERYDFNATGTYSLVSESVDISDAYEPDDTIPEATSLSTNEIQSRSFDSEADIDYVEVSVKAGASYVFSAQSENSASAQGAGPNIYLVDGQASVLAESIGVPGVSTSALEWSAQQDGVYYLRLTPPVVQGVVQIGRYDLSMSENPFELSADVYEPDNSLDGASRIKPLEPQSRTLHRGSDVDYVRLEIPAGATYIVETQVQEGEATDTVLTLLNNDGAILQEDDDGGAFGGSVLSISSTVEQGFYLEVTAFTSEDFGPYTLVMYPPQ